MEEALNKLLPLSLSDETSTVTAADDNRYRIKFNSDRGGFCYGFIYF